MKKILVLMLTLCLLMTNFTYANSDNPSSWSEEGINQLKEYNQFRDSTFSNYNENITRAEFIYLAVRIYELFDGREIIPDPSISFNDTTDIYALKGATVGITSGIGDGKFGPDMLLTREQLAVLMMNILKIGNVEINKPTGYVFSDEAEFSVWSKESIYSAKANNIISGVGDDMFDSQGSATKEVAIVITNRLLKNNEGKKWVNREKINTHVVVEKTDFETQEVHDITRGEMCHFIVENFDLTMLSKLEDRDISIFKDVHPDNKYYDDIVKTYELGLSGPEPSDSFGLDNIIFRAEFAALLINYKKRAGYDLTNIPEKIVEMNDVDESYWYYDIMSTFLKLGIYNLDDKGNLYAMNAITSRDLSELTVSIIDEWGVVISEWSETNSYSSKGSFVSVNDNTEIKINSIKFEEFETKGNIIISYTQKNISGDPVDELSIYIQFTDGKGQVGYGFFGTLKPGETSTRKAIIEYSKDNMPVYIKAYSSDSTQSAIKYRVRWKAE